MCEKMIENKGAKRLLETVKNVEFDVIVQDITLYQCLYGLWEVKAKQKVCINKKNRIRSFSLRLETRNYNSSKDRVKNCRNA